MLVRVPEALVGRGCVNSTTATHATSGVQVSCWCGSSSSTCDARTNMDDVHGGGAAMWRQRGNQAIKQSRKNSISAMLLSVYLSILSASRGGCCGMVAARFSPAPSGMIEGISAGAHEIERHDRSMRDIDLVVWCLAGGESRGTM